MEPTQQEGDEIAWKLWAWSWKIPVPVIVVNVLSIHINRPTREVDVPVTVRVNGQPSPLQLNSGQSTQLVKQQVNQPEQPVNTASMPHETACKAGRSHEGYE